MDNNRSEFIIIIQQEFESWCKSKELQPTNSLFLEYLISRNLIQEKTIKRFIVVNNYPEALDKNLGIKKAAIWDLEEKTGVNESTIRVWIKRFQSFFRLSANS